MKRIKFLKMIIKMDTPWNNQLCPYHLCFYRNRINGKNSFYFKIYLKKKGGCFYDVYNEKQSKKKSTNKIPTSLKNRISQSSSSFAE